MQGKIACANVLSDLYAMGVADCDNMLMLLGEGEFPSCSSYENILVDACVLGPRGVNEVVCCY